MEMSKKEGAPRPLYSSAPILPEKAEPAPTLWQALPRRRVWLAALAASYAAGWFYVRVLALGSEQDQWAWAAFPVLFIAGVEAFARALGRRGARGAPFWAVCWLLQGTAMLLYGLHSELALWQLLAWHLTAVYWVLARTGMQAAGRANAMLAADGIAGLFTLPWSDIALRTRILAGALGAWRRGRAQRRTPQARRRRQELAAGILLALALGGYALAELSAADTAFGAFIGRWLRWPQLSDRQLARLVGDIFTLLLSLPVGAWLFGLVGGALRRTRPPLAEGDVYRALGRAPRLPALTGQLAVGGLCAVYALFFAVQAAEFLPALGAPLAPQQVSRFAVEGFWQLCRILLLDFAVLAAVHFFGARPADAPGRQRAGLCVFGAFGLAFAALAAAKLGLYIHLYGLTPRRVLSAWVLGVLGLGCVLALVRLFRRIPAVRVLAAALALSFSLLCCADIERACLRDHLARLETGRAETVDWDLVGNFAYMRGDLAEEAARALKGMELAPSDAARLAKEPWAEGVPTGQPQSTRG